jgi:putative ABC transport system permease protein
VSNLLGVKLRRDLRASWSRFVLMIGAIAVSLTVFGAVLSAWAAIERETSGAYLSTQPASATIVLDHGITTEQMAAIAAQVRSEAQVIEATGRTQFTSEVEVNGQPRAIPLQVYVAASDDPMRMVKFDLTEAGSWPPSAGEIRLAGDSQALLAAESGDSITVTTPNGERLQLRVGGTVYDPSLAPSVQEQAGHGYLSTTSLATSGAGPLLDQLKIQVSDPGSATPTRDRATAVAVASKVAAWLQQQHGLTVAEVQVPEPYAHPHQYQADILLLSLLGGGLAALVLSTILVASMLNNLFTQQTPQIGILKAIGATSARITRHYLVMTVLVATTATALALAPAMLIGRQLLGQVLGMLGIRPVSVAAPWWADVVIITVGIGLPVMMAAVPLSKISRITVRTAMDYTGGTSKPSRATALLARLAGLRFLSRGLLMALRNTVRRPARFWLAAGLLAGAGAVFVAGMSLRAGMETQTAEQNSLRTWDVDVQLASPVPATKAANLIQQLPDVSRVEGWHIVSTGVAGSLPVPVTRTYPDQGHGRIAVTVIPDGSVLFKPPALLEGRWLRRAEPGAVVLNQIVRKTTVPDTHPGDTVRLFIGGHVTTWRVVGIVEERAGSGLYATASGFAATTGHPERVNQLRVVTDRHDEATRIAVARIVERRLSEAGIAVKAAESVSRAEASATGHAGPLVMIFVLIAVAMGAVGCIGLASTMSANVLDRTREFGVMHAIGARSQTVRRIVIAEGVLLALISCLVAVVPALGLTALLGNGLGDLFLNAPLPYRISVPAAGLWIVLVTVGAALATGAAASRASRITVREALSYV